MTSKLSHEKFQNSTLREVQILENIGFGINCYTWGVLLGTIGEAHKNTTGVHWVIPPVTPANASSKFVARFKILVLLCASVKGKEKSAFQ